MKKIFIVCIISILLNGCATWMSSKKANNNSKGIEYALPQPFLMVTPKSDGTTDVEVILLPDNEKKYTITQTSIFSSHSLDVELQNGLLKSVSLNSDSSTVPSKAIEGYGEISKAKIDADALSTKAELQKISEARSKLVEAQAAVDKASKLIEYLENYIASNPTDEAAKAELLKANISLIQAESDLVTASNNITLLGLPLNTNGFNLALGAGTGKPKAFGPVLYRIHQSKPVAPSKDVSISLQAVKFPGTPDTEQKEFETSMLALPPVAKPPVFKLSPNTVIVNVYENIFITKSNVKINSIDNSRSTFHQIQNDGSLVLVSQMPSFVLQSNGSQIQIGVSNKLNEGKYNLSLVIQLEGTPPLTVRKDIKIEMVK